MSKKMIKMINPRLGGIYFILFYFYSPLLSPDVIGVGLLLSDDWGFLERELSFVILSLSWEKTSDRLSGWLVEWWWESGLWWCWDVSMRPVDITDESFWECSYGDWFFTWRSRVAWHVDIKCALMGRRNGTVFVAIGASISLRCGRSRSF